MIDNRDTQAWFSWLPVRLMGVILVVTLALSLSACFESIGDGSGQEDGDDSEPVNQADRDKGIRFMFVSPEGDSVHVYFDDQRVGSNIGFPVGSGYIDTVGEDELEGDVEIRLVERLDDDEEDEDQEPRTLAEKTVTFDEDTRLSAFITGDGDDLSIGLVDEHFEGETDASTVFRLSHFAGNKGELDIYLTSDDAGDLSELSPTYESVALGETSDYMSVDAESAPRLRVAPAGEDELLFDSGDSSGGGVMYFFQGDRIHLVLMDFSDDALSNARGLSMIGGQAFVQSVEHTNPVQGLRDARSRAQLTQAVADAEPMDFMVEGEKVVSEINYGEHSDAIVVTGGDRVVQPMDSESGAAIGVSEDTLRFLRRQGYSIVLVGSQQSGQKRWAKGRVSRASEDIDEDSGRIFIHGVNGYLGGPDKVDLVLNDVLLDTGYELEFGEYEVFTQSMPIESDENRVRFYESDGYVSGDEPIAEKTVDLESGKAYTAILVGSPEADPEILMISHSVLD